MADSLGGLVEAARQGNEQAFMRLVERHYGLVWAIAFSRTSDWAAAEDLAQETFLAAYLHLGRLRKPDSFAPWVGMIARRLAANWVRSAEYGRRLAVMLRVETMNAQAQDQREALVQREEVSNALKELPDALRETVVLFYLQGQSVAETAGLLQVSETAVRTRLYQARKRLKRILMADLAGLFSVPPHGPSLSQIQARLAQGPAVPAVTSAAAVTGLRFLVVQVLGVEVSTAAIKVAAVAAVVAASGLFIYAKQYESAPAVGQEAAGLEAASAEAAGGPNGPAPTGPLNAPENSTGTAKAASPARLSAKVTDETSGKPVLWTELELAGGGVILKGRATLKEGFAFDRVAAGRHRLTCSHPFYETRSVDVVCEGGVAAEVEVRLERKPGISGRVLTADGKPANRVSLCRQLPGGRSAWFSGTDEDGEYFGAQDGGTYELFAGSDRTFGCKSGSVKLTLKPGDSVTQDFTLPAHGSVAFDFRTPSGDQVTEFQHCIAWLPSEKAVGCLENPVPREDGLVGFDYLLPGDYEAAFLFEGYEPALLKVRLDPLKPAPPVSVRLEPARDSLHIRVVDQKNQPVTGLKVHLGGFFDAKDSAGEPVDRQLRMTVASGILNGEGECFFRGLLPGKYAPYSFDVKGLENEEEIAVEAPASGVVMFRVEAEKPARPNRLFAEFFVKDEETGEVVKAPAQIEQSIDKFVIGPQGDVVGGYPGLQLDLRPGKNVVVAVSPGRTAFIEPVVIGEQDMRVERAYRPVVLSFGEKCGTISGVVSDAAGNPLPNARLMVLPEALFSPGVDFEEGLPKNICVREMGFSLAQGERTREDGTFVLGHLPEGAYYVAAIYEDSRAPAQYGDLVRVEEGMTTGPVLISSGL